MLTFTLTIPTAAARGKESDSIPTRGIRLLYEGIIFGLIIGMCAIGFSLIYGTTGLTIKLKRETQQISETDTPFYWDGYVTITPLQTDWTAHQDIKVLKKWPPLELPVEPEAPAAQQATPR